jgi:enoyl-CoA hydratase/carnithine racemase
MTAEIETRRVDGFQTIRFTRPGKKNAITRAMYEAMGDALGKGEADAQVAVHVFLGSEGFFSAGNDVNDFLANAAGDAGATGGALRFLHLLPVIKKPMIAAVDGPAVGVAVTLLFHCDLVYASRRATFSTPFLDLGLVPENASSLLAPQIMGHARAFELLVLGETFGAERAREAGFVNSVVADGEAEAVAFASALRLAAKPPEALRRSRAFLRPDPGLVLARSDEETAAFLELLKEPEAREAFSAFLEKRRPDFAKLRRAG